MKPVVSRVVAALKATGGDDSFLATVVLVSILRQLDNDGPAPGLFSALAAVTVLAPPDAN